ncbi:glycoside hydrolase family 3 N-terminal domain-containing protein [Bifidobacterium gallicum]|uniref:beta-N-acetylhexosaminidase n=1 Tax=Bifidobacterium gallicum DSM 20093 = LMG 11596 TaxID=561180 RepID=D1NS41_9BIFI|nr:glycoside hydrolase family 3 N-terminal domain-containing protein [Bifidobacterium gallicum]EFA23493.1 glycosyl hydrolase family 3 N-terminal domain protein [Bifidobacterium gallicum DSM 20093 = LMG 11596]KFI57225.1 putative beta-N-acetylhexosaminidase [Bifidobacterium gallicum DSM 20093 = LMG 11596]
MTSDNEHEHDTTQDTPAQPDGSHGVNHDDSRGSGNGRGNGSAGRNSSSNGDSNSNEHHDHHHWLHDLTNKHNPIRIVVIVLIWIIVIASLGLFGWITFEPNLPASGLKQQNMVSANGNGYTDAQASPQPSSSSSPQDKKHESLKEELEATPTTTTPQQQAQQAVEHMSLEEQAGQLVMAPLTAGTEPSTLEPMIKDRHLGSILLLGNWDSGIAGVRQATTTLQQYVNDNIPMFIATDQEGGAVQHLTGSGFTTIPSARQQGQMSDDKLMTSAEQWGQQLRQAGVNIDLAPSLDTVVIDRSSNAPIGALDRDFGLSAKGNAQHGIAFVEGMRKADVGATIKHYPGLGAVTGNTDFTADGTVDTVTDVNSIQLQAFNNAIAQVNPAMVMISLGIYENLDPNVPAAFSSYIINTVLRDSTGYDGVVISDSLSAQAVKGYVPADLGTKFIQAGGDIVCLSDLSMVGPVLDGIVYQAQNSPDFANLVKASAKRVLTLKYEMHLIEKN